VNKNYNYVCRECGHHWIEWAYTGGSGAGLTIDPSQVATTNTNYYTIPFSYTASSSIVLEVQTDDWTFTGEDFPS
jgi:hypothetical protein